MWDGSVYFSHGTTHSKGVTVLIDSKLDIQVINVNADRDGRYIIIECVIQGLKMTLSNVYFPVRGKHLEQITFLKDFDKKLKELNFTDNPMIVGGDFNTIRNLDLDYLGSNKRQVQTGFSRHFENFANNLQLIDIWRTRNGIKKQFTFRQVNPFMQSRLDYRFITEKLEEIVVNCNIIPSLAPDHSAVQLQFYNKPILSSNAKSSYWKFNNSLCKDDEYVQLMKEEIIDLKQKYQKEIKDSRILWDFKKMKIGNFTRKYSKEKVRKRKQKINDLEKEITRIENELIAKIEKDKVDRLECIRTELKACYDYISEGIKIRSRASFYESGEKDTRYFKQLLESNQKKTMIKKLLIGDEQVLSFDQNEILREIKKFYGKLYSESADVLKNPMKLFSLEIYPNYVKSQKNYVKEK